MYLAGILVFIGAVTAAAGWKHGSARRIGTVLALCGVIAGLSIYGAAA